MTSNAAIFATTRWTLIAAAGRDSSPESQRALSELCTAYWFPLYAFVRRQGRQPADAQDLTQSFFAELLEKERLQIADQDRGRFRTFLLAALRNFLANAARNARAQKRGGGHVPLALDFIDGESRYQHEPAHELTAERLFERQWATTMLDRTMLRLRAEFVAAGKLPLFEMLKLHLGGDGGQSYDSIASELNITGGAVKVAVHRLRHRCRELLREEITHTVATPADVDDELRALFRAVDVC